MVERLARGDVTERSIRGSRGCRRTHGGDRGIVADSARGKSQTKNQKQGHSLHDENVHALKRFIQRERLENAGDAMICGSPKQLTNFGVGKSAS